jgi:hypothetical protein
MNNYLAKLPDDLKELVVKLPFRVGVFISDSDKTGGDDSADAERKALENIVTFYVEDTVKGEFAHSVMLETLNQKSNWQNWIHDTSKVPEECALVAYKLKDFIEAKEVLAYKQNLVEVAIAVAQAYCEFDDKAGLVGKIETYSSILMRRLQLMFSGGTDSDMSSNDYLLNISKVERSAIKLLADTLDVKVRV